MIKNTFILIPLLFILSCQNKKSFIPEAKINFGKYEITLASTGALRAKNSTIVRAPSVIKQSSKIIEMIKEGNDVRKGDFLIQFDKEEIEKQIESIGTELNEFNEEIKKSDATHAFQLKQIGLELDNAETRYKLAKMRLKQIEFESKAKQEEEKLSFKLAQNDYIEIKGKLKLQSVLNKSERSQLIERYKRTKLKLDNRKEALGKMSLVSPDSGMVVYSKIWKGNRMEKLKIGDTPWRGQALMEITDLSKMEIETTINEIDIAKVAIGDSVKITLDAYANKTYKGIVEKISTLAHNDEVNYDQKIFDVNIKVFNPDIHLKPGMTTKADIITAVYDSVYYLPIESIFHDEKHNYIFVRNENSSGYKKYPVTITNKDAVYAIIEAKDNFGKNKMVALSKPEK